MSETVDNGVLERTFELSVSGERVTGVVWTAVGASSDLPALLMGHGGGQHKKAPGIAMRAPGFVTSLEIAMIAIDAPGHGDRPASEHVQQFSQMLRRKMANAEPVGLDVARWNARQAAQMVPEWQATLDALQAQNVVGKDKPVGFGGMAMGAAIGVQLVAAEPRIRAASFGLTGLEPEDEVQAAAAAKVQVPVEYVMRWDDELVSRASSLALFDALGTRDKTLHAYPGGHMARLPESEVEGSLRFFRRQRLA